MANNKLLRASRHPTDTANKEKKQAKGWFHYCPTIHLYPAETLLLYYSKYDFVLKKSAFHINSQCRSTCDDQLQNRSDAHQCEHSAPAQPALTLTICADILSLSPFSYQPSTTVTALVCRLSIEDMCDVAWLLLMLNGVTVF